MTQGWHEAPNPLTDKAPLHQLAAVHVIDTKTSIKPHFQYEDETDKIALERFPISKLKKLGAGSDRIVYDLEDGNVIKIAKNARGLLQNSYETPDYLLKDLLPEVRESGLDYVVVEKLDINRKKANLFLKPLKNFYPQDFDNKTSELQDVFEKLDIKPFMDYDILFNDFKSPRNWGFRNNKPILIDMGSLSKDILDKETLKYFIPKWKEVLLRKRQWNRSQKL